MTQVTSIGVQFTEYPSCTAGISSLTTAAADGFTSVIVNLPEAISPSLDHAELLEFHQAATDLGVSVQSGVGCIGPRGDAHEVLGEMTRRIEAGTVAGIGEFFAYTRSDRSANDFNEQLRTIEGNLRELTPALRTLGCRLNLKTHEDLSSHEVERVVERLDPEIFGVGLDVANLVVRGEDPAEVSRRLADRIRQTHLDDIALFEVDDGLRRRLRPVGDGVFDWEAILSPLLQAGVAFLTLEHHRGRFDADIFRRSWFGTEPDLTAADVGQLCRMAKHTRARVASGRIPPLSELEAEPSPEALREQFVRSRLYLQDLVQRIARNQNPSTKEVS